MTDKPLATFALFAYNQEKYIREAIEGAFAQTYSPLEIILSDDCSSDRTYKIMEEMANSYDGPHKITLNRNPENLGLSEHVNRVMELVSGEIVVVAAGDDISLPERTKTSVEVFQANPDLMTVSLGILVFSDEVPSTPKSACDYILRKYSIDDYIRNAHFHLNAPARAFRRRVFDEFGPLYSKCQVEDGPILFRSLLIGNCGYLPQISVFYRHHRNNMYAGDTTNRQSLDFQAIFEQYYIDLDLMTKRGRIKDNHATRIRKSTRVRLQRELIKLKWQQPGFKPIRFLKYILFSDYFSFNVKKRMAKEAFGITRKFK